MLGPLLLVTRRNNSGMKKNKINYLVPEDESSLSFSPFPPPQANLLSTSFICYHIIPHYLTLSHTISFQSPIFVAKITSLFGAVFALRFPFKNFFQQIIFFFFWYIQWPNQQTFWPLTKLVTDSVSIISYNFSSFVIGAELNTTL